METQIDQLKNELHQIKDDIKKLEKSKFYQSRSIAGDSSYKMDYVNKCLALPENIELINKHGLKQVSDFF